MIIAISVITRTGYNEQIQFDLRARYIRFLLYIKQKENFTENAINLKVILLPSI